jgi:hypothetical protein
LSVERFWTISQAMAQKQGARLSLSVVGSGFWKRGVFNILLCNESNAMSVNVAL